MLTGADAAPEAISQHADLNDSTLTLGPNGYAFIALPDGKVKLN
ncbi:hypothetical protein N8D56_24325 [Devosia sp. A8/3-2]|nr:hypothetical protein N8D56_24325 [Devosia sp. A8/3-2]